MTTRRPRLAADVQLLLDLYPRIYFACHTRHVRDPRSDDVISARQAQILDHVDAVDPISVSTLAQHLSVTASTMSLAIDRLERLGLVRRVPDAEDGRRVGVVATPAGQRMQEANSVLDPDRVRAILTRLDPASRRRALDGLALLADAAEAVTIPNGGVR